MQNKNTLIKLKKEFKKIWFSPLKNEHVQLIIAFSLLLTAFLSFSGLFLSYQTFREEQYLNYPHLSISYTCQKESENYLEFTTSIVNLGKYGELYSLELNISDNFRFNLDGDDFKNKTSFVINGGQTIAHKIGLFPDVKTTGNFSIQANYTCFNLIKPCDFWTIKNFTCSYEKQIIFPNVEAKWKLN